MFDDFPNNFCELRGERVLTDADIGDDLTVLAFDDHMPRDIAIFEQNRPPPLPICSGIFELYSVGADRVAVAEPAGERIADAVSKIRIVDDRLGAVVDPSLRNRLESDAIGVGLQCDGTAICGI